MKMLNGQANIVIKGHPYIDTGKTGNFSVDCADLRVKNEVVSFDRSKG